MPGPRADERRSGSAGREGEAGPRPAGRPPSTQYAAAVAAESPGTCPARPG